MRQQSGVLIEKNVTTGEIFSDSACFTGYFNFSLSGTWVGKVYLQRSFDGGVTWLDRKDYAANTEADPLIEPEGEVLYRAGIKSAGDYTSGTAVVRISQ